MGVTNREEEETKKRERPGGLLGWNLRPTSRICVMTNLVASKLSEASMHSTPTTFKFTSPYDAMAVPTAISRMAAMS